MGRLRASTVQSSANKFVSISRAVFDMDGNRNRQRKSAGSSSQPVSIELGLTATVAELTDLVRDMVEWGASVGIVTVVDSANCVFRLPDQSAPASGSNSEQRPQGRPRAGSQRVVKRRDSGRNRKRQQQRR